MVNEAATKDAIRHFADGIGDPNPLWRDPEYAGNTVHKGLVAPPAFLNAIVPGQWSQGWPRVPRYALGCEWEWFRPIRVNDTFTCANLLEDVVVKRAEPVGQRRYLQSGRLQYHNQHGEMAGFCRWSTMFYEISGEPAKPSSDKPQVREPYVYSQAELDAIDRAYAEEAIRGAKPRYWEDVAVGEELKPVVKGPLTHADMVAFIVGLGYMSQAHSLSPFRKPGSPVWKDLVTNVTEPGAGVHFLDKVARGLAGEPFAFNMGIQRVCWLGHLMTNWIGNEGSLKKLEARFRKVSYFGDTTWCRGKVTRKYVQGKEYLVECELWTENQRQEKDTLGSALVALPSKTAHNG
ncbi:MAG: MaoC family dehydratase N-terminal domain-containing protein [Pseudomonadota bacterium]